ncbi:MAG: alkaline phosphatase family protein [Armatimonadetes bacterium]|nr:alkaline phosphatase family protein [Armatimonadota bacterium]
MSDNKRVMLIGWDCAPPALVFDQYREAMPNFSRLMGESSWGKLRSTDPPITVPAWTCMFSSVNPGGLGFFGFRNLRKGTYDGRWIATAEAVKVDRVWDIASRYGKRCCVLGVPQTYPPKPLNGCLVASFLTPSTDSQYTYPPELKQEVEEVSDGYMVDVDNFRTEDKDRLLADIYRMTDKHFAVARHLLTREDWDLFMYVEMGPDRIQHGFWKYIDPTHAKYEPGNRFENCLRDYYAHLDAQLGELLSLAGEDVAVVVMSDHGAKAMRGNFHVNDWLIREGLLKLKEQPDGVVNIKPEMIDWPHTVAWAWGGYYSRVFMNVEGREPEGCVPADQYKKVRDELAERLESVQDDQGRVMATRALKPQDIYTGPYVDDAPDLLVYFDDLDWRAGQDVGHDGLHSFDTEIGPDDAVHDYHGILLVHEPGQSTETPFAEAKAVDVAPTILDLLGLPRQSKMEGRSLLAG